MHDLGPNKSYSSEIWHSSSFCEEQYGTVKKRRRNRRYRRKPPSAAKFFLSFLAELDNSESIEANLFFLKKFLSFLHLTLEILQKKSHNF